MVFNVNQGIPYFQTVWIGVPNIQQFKAALRAAFLTVPNVVEVISLITSQDKRYFDIYRYYTNFFRVAVLPE